MSKFSNTWPSSVFPGIPSGPGTRVIGVPTGRSRSSSVWNATLLAVPMASREVTLSVHSATAGVAATVVWVVGDTVYSKTRRWPPMFEVSILPPAGNDPTATDGLVTHWMSVSAVARCRVTPVRLTLPTLEITSVISHFSPVSQNASPSPLTSFTVTDSTTRFGSVSLPQFTSTPNDTMSSGTPLLSPSIISGESQASPSPSLSASAWRVVPAMIGGLASTGQSSMPSGTPSASTSSSTAWQPPEFAMLCFWQVSGAIATQVHCCVLTVQMVFTFSAQKPVVGHWALLVHWMVLLRLHEPIGRVTTWALTQSPSQASPSRSPSAFVCGRGLGVRTQLSTRSLTPSPSRSALLESQAAPRPVPPAPSVCSGL